MSHVFKPSLLTRSIARIAPGAAVKRMAAERILHAYRYDGAEMGHKRASATQNMSPNDFSVQRDRLQLMREAEDLERNFAPAKMLNRKYALYVSPISYHAATGDHKLDADIEDYLNLEVFPNCDHTERYDFWRLFDFGIMGVNRGGDYGFAFTRPGIEPGMSEEEAVKLPLKIQAIEPDRIGGVYQNVVSNDYVAGLMIGDHGQIEAYRVFHRSMTTNCYDNPVEIPAKDFVFMLDTLRSDSYRGVSRLATAVQNLRDLYESIDFVKGKMKIASALTVFTNSNGSMGGPGAMDAYQTNIFEGDQGGMQQDINFGQINHLAGGTEIKFPSSNTPSSEEQWVMVQLLKFVAMSYDLPYSFALDASALGGVSSRLESEMAKAEFERGQRVFSPYATRIKDTFLMDAIAKDVFPARLAGKICKGRWGYRAHPQPDIGREASAAVSLYEHGMLDPVQYWIDNASDPEGVAANMARWAKIKRDTAAEAGMDVVEIFGNGPSKPLSISESTTESTTNDASGKQFSRHAYKESDSSINARLAKESEMVDYCKDWISDLRGDAANFERDGKSELLQETRIEIDKAKSLLADHESARDALQARRDRRDSEKTPDETPDRIKAKREMHASWRSERHMLIVALQEKGKSKQESYAIAYHIFDAGKFNIERIPREIQLRYRVTTDSSQV